MTARKIGTIIIAVAVFDIHMDKNAAVAMNPITILEGPPPMSRMIRRAIRLCKFHFSIVRAIIKPPKKRKIVLLIYIGAVVLPFKMPKTGKRIMGSSAVAKRGIASVTHQVAISAVTAAIRVTAGLSGSKSKNSRIVKNKKSPRYKPILWVVVLFILVLFAGIIVFIAGFGSRSVIGV